MTSVTSATPAAREAREQREEQRPSTDVHEAFRAVERLGRRRTPTPATRTSVR